MSTARDARKKEKKASQEEMIKKSLELGYRNNHGLCEIYQMLYSSMKFDSEEAAKNYKVHFEGVMGTAFGYYIPEAKRKKQRE